MYFAMLIHRKVITALVAAVVQCLNVVRKGVFIESGQRLSEKQRGAGKGEKKNSPASHKILVIKRYFCAVVYLHYCQLTINVMTIPLNKDLCTYMDD